MIRKYFSRKRDLIEDMYTPLSEAKKEIQRRWNNPKLREKVARYIGDVPGIFKEKPQAVLFRFIATPDFEYNRARHFADKLGLPILYLEFLKDKFCTRNQDKVSLGKMHFFHGKKNNGENLITTQKIIDLQKEDGKRFDKIMIYSGERLVDFHHRIFKPYFKKTNILDISSLAFKNGKNAFEMYPFFLLFFTCFGVLLEAYDVNHSKDEKNFASDIVRPAFDKVTKKIGVRPLIVRLYDNGDEGNKYWCCYPEFLKNQINLQRNK